MVEGGQGSGAVNTIERRTVAPRSTSIYTYTQSSHKGVWVGKGLPSRAQKELKFMQLPSPGILGARAETIMTNSGRKNRSRDREPFRTAVARYS